MLVAGIALRPVCYLCGSFPRRRGKVGMGAIVERVINADSLQKSKNYSRVTYVQRKLEHSPPSQPSPIFMGEGADLW
jgi:hypothetical protein